jgi:hypothetical protein
MSQSTGPAEVLVELRQRGLSRAGPADRLQPGRDLKVAKAGIVTAVGADDLEHGRVAAIPVLPRRRGRLTPQHSSQAMAGLPSGKGRHGVSARLPGRSGYGVPVRIAHLTPKAENSAAGVWSSTERENTHHQGRDKPRSRVAAAPGMAAV